jgi:hypothetical protein
MLTILPRFLSRIYRKEPISSFILTVGVVDAVIGGLDGEWSLFTFSVIILLLALGVRWWHLQSPDQTLNSKTPRRYLPPSSSAQALPMLAKEKPQKF